VAQRHRHLWLKILIGVVAALALADVLALTFLVAPLRASQQARANTADRTAQRTRSTLDQALILPTHDPRKPWVTRTPLPTITPWLIPTATPAPTATATPMLANAPAPELAPDAPDAAGAAASSPTAGAIRPTGTASPTPTPPATIAPTDMRVATNVLPTATPVPPTSTPSPTRPPDTPQSPPPIASGDAARFEAYVRDHYDNIVGYPLNIMAVTIDTTEAGLPEITVHLAYDDTETGFAAQNGKDTADYGHRLLGDVKRFFDDQSCAVAVVSEYDTSDPEACRNNPTWCTVTAQDRSNHSWTITWTYVLGTSVDGADSVQTWS
jgi:hypothetical protein